jgi:hypothetical protein
MKYRDGGINVDDKRMKTRPSIFANIETASYHFNSAFLVQKMQSAADQSARALLDKCH